MLKEIIRHQNQSLALPLSDFLKLAEEAVTKLKLHVKRHLHPRLCIRRTLWICV